MIMTEKISERSGVSWLRMCRSSFGGARESMNVSRERMKTILVDVYALS